MATNRKRWSKTLVWTLSVLIVLLVTARLLLPHYVLKYVNRQLENMHGYTGHVEDIDIWLIRGAYIIKGMVIRETDTESRIRNTPFFEARAIDLSLEWSALFHGRIAGKVKMEEPVLNFKRKKTDETSFKADTADFRQLVRNIMPLTINRFRIVRGQIHYIDVYSSPKVDIRTTNIDVLALNLSNVQKKNVLLPSSIQATGKAYGGEMNLNMKLDPLNKKPTFDLNLELKNCQLTQMNDFMNAYANVKVNSGTFGLYTELAGKDYKVTGYVKPLIKDLHIEVWKKDESLGQKLWSALVAGVAKIFTNPPHDQLGTEVHINGTFNDPDVGLWTAIKYVVINAFIEALKPQIDNTVNIQSVGTENKKKGFFDRLFSKKKK